MPVKLQLRLSDALHAALRDQTTANERSLNAELIDRLERSLGQSGENADRLGRAVAIVAQAVGEKAAAYVQGNPDWADDPWAYGQVCFGIMELLRRFAPAGPMVRPEPPETLIEGLMLDGTSREKARRLAEGIVDRGPSLHTVGYLAGRGKGPFHAGAHAFQNVIGPKWAGRLSR
jgi:hypothetical protein